MPQKLIRLTSTTGDGVFNTIFNEELVIPESSEIALQSLTLERRSQEFAVNQDNNQIQFQGVGLVLPDVPTNSGNIIPLGIYKNSNDISLLTAIERTCNNNSSMLTTPDSMNLQWEVDTGNDGKVEIKVIPSPLFPVTATAKLGIDGFVIGFLGRVSYEKGVHILLSALERIIDYKWTLLIDTFEIYKSKYGEGIHDQMVSTGLIERVVSINPKHDQLGDYINSVDVVVMPLVSTPLWIEQYG